MPKRVNSPEDNKMRLDGYLVSDIRDCLVHTEEDTLERFRKAQNKPEFNPSAGFGGNLWFAKRGMFDISLWLIVLNMTAVPLMAVSYTHLDVYKRQEQIMTGLTTNKTGYCFPWHPITEPHISSIIWEMA